MNVAWSNSMGIGFEEHLHFYDTQHKLHFSLAHHETT